MVFNDPAKDGETYHPRPKDESKKPIAKKVGLILFVGLVIMLAYWANA